MTDKLVRYETEDIGERIYALRGQKIITDFDLAAIYGVTTKRLNEQVKRNEKRFPADFMFQLTQKEWDDLRSQIATSNLVMRSQNATASSGNRSQIATGSQRHRDPRFMPFVFTEHGALMAANVLNSPQAVEMSLFVIRAFVRMRGLLGDTRELARRLTALEKELKERLDVHEGAIVGILQRIMDIIDPPVVPEPPLRPKRKIGFIAKEQRAEYAAKRKRR